MTGKKQGFLFLVYDSGEIPKWPKGTGCKPAGTAFGGSNPPLSTIKSAEDRKNAGVAQW
jgi:hypothetical protein